MGNRKKAWEDGTEKKSFVLKRHAANVVGDRGFDNFFTEYYMGMDYLLSRTNSLGECDVEMFPEEDSIRKRVKGKVDRIWFSDVVYSSPNTSAIIHKHIPFSEYVKRGKPDKLEGFWQVDYNRKIRGKNRNNFTLKLDNAWFHNQESTCQKAVTYLLGISPNVRHQLSLVDKGGSFTAPRTKESSMCNPAILEKAVYEGRFSSNGLTIQASRDLNLKDYLALGNPKELTCSYDMQFL